jgi:hypothetical protein
VGGFVFNLVVAGGWVLLLLAIFRSGMEPESVEEA